MKTDFWRAAVLALIASTIRVAGAEPTFGVGDVAPKLQTGKWVQGEPVKTFEEGKAYLVEFWATWCGPCRVSIPHVNGLHSRYQEKGLIVIGQDCWEQDETKVEPFLKSMGDKMTYRVALDDKKDGGKGRMAETWMSAAGRDGIPSAFLVDIKGRIAWIGHPMQLEDRVIEEVLAGKFDVAKAAADYARDRKNQAELRSLSTALNQAMRNKDWDAALARLDDAAPLLPESQRAGLDMQRFGILLAKKDYPAAYEWAGKISEASADNARLQNDLAWRIATDPSIEKRDLELAETIALRANKAAQGEDAAILDTLARVLFMRGKKTEAVEIQEKAVKLAEGETKATLEKALESYKEGRLPSGE